MGQRVLVVDDSALTRQILARALALDPQIEVVGTARNGLEAIERAKTLKPDVVTLDIEMPVLGGLEALPFLVRDSEARVLVLSSVEDPDTTYEALAAGAVDFIPKPKGGFASSIEELAETLVKKIRVAFRVPPRRAAEIAGPLRSLVEGERPVTRRVPQGRPADGLLRVVSIAASTGGPPALERVFSDLDASILAAYTIVQHLPAGFTASLVDRLRRVTDLDVVEGADRMTLEPATAYLAPHGVHMTVERQGTRLRLRMVDGPSMHGVKPAGDPLLTSVAEACGADGVGVVLSGMGSDGAEGLAAIADAGGTTIVQDEPSSVVWGMPGACVRRGAAQQVLPLAEIASAVRAALGEG
jgi:two-component system chemotaxis response regulator CheB